METEFLQNTDVAPASNPLSHSEGEDDEADFKPFLSTPRPVDSKADEQGRDFQKTKVVFEHGDSREPAPSGVQAAPPADVGGEVESPHVGPQSLKEQIDAIFDETDMRSSLKTFLARLSNMLGKKLSLEERKLAKTYIKELVNRRTCSEEERTPTQSDQKKRPSVVNEAISLLSPAKTLKPGGAANNNVSELNISKFAEKTGCPSRPSESSKATSPFNDPGFSFAVPRKEDLEFCKTRRPGAEGNEVNAETLPTKRKRGHPRSQGDAAKTDTAVNSKMSNQVKSNARQRLRRGSCALCATCPCSISAGTRNNTTDMDFATFARSDAAIEKALIRRVQEMEKKCELNEERMEALRRTLKQHRRRIWKKKEKKVRVSEELAKNHFLPDAQSFEQTAHVENARPSSENVRRVQKAIFPYKLCKSGSVYTRLRSRCLI